MTKTITWTATDESGHALTAQSVINNGSGAFMAGFDPMNPPAGQPGPNVTQTWGTPGRIQMAADAPASGHLATLSQTHVPYLGPGSYLNAAMATSGPATELLIDSCLIEAAMIVASASNPQSRRVHVRNSRWAPAGMAAQSETGGQVGAITGPVFIEYSEIIPIIHGIECGSDFALNQPPTQIDHCWIHGPGWAYYSGKLLNGTWMTAVQAQQGYTTKFAPGMQVSPDNSNGPAFFSTPGNNWGYQVISAGTLGLSTTGWPATANSGATFTPPGGTAVLYPIGNVEHMDALSQFGTGQVIVTNSRLEGCPNAAMLQQGSPTNPLTKDGYPAAPVLMVFDSNYLQADNYALYLSGYAPGGPKDPNTGGTLGNWTRASSTSWTFNATNQKRLCGVTVTNNRFGPKAGAVPTYTTSVVRGITGGDEAVCVRTAAQRQQGIAAQFGWSTSDPRIAEMLNGQYDWTSPPTPIFSVLEQRRNAGIPDPSCDALAWWVWANNQVDPALDGVGALIHPTPWQKKGGAFDAQGYYTGV